MEVESNKYWETSAKDYHTELEVEKEVLHPYIASLVNNLDGTKILDYGCGNGYLSSLFAPNKEVTLYDISDAHLNAVDQWELKNDIVICDKESDLQDNYYDIVVQSSVIMCIPTLEEMKKMIEKIYRCLRFNGHFVLSITHPCFLQYEYGHYKTSFNHNNFNYLADGKAYTVFMKRIGNNPVEFKDYNWSLSTIINLLIETGFELIDMIEHPDLKSKEFEPKKEGCPWMFLTLKK